MNSAPGARGGAGLAAAKAESRCSALPPLAACPPGGMPSPDLAPALHKGFRSPLSARLEEIRMQTLSGSLLPSF